MSLELEDSKMIGLLEDPEVISISEEKPVNTDASMCFTEEKAR